MSHNKTSYLNYSNTFEIKNKLVSLSRNFNKNTNSQIKFTDYEIASLGLAEMNHSSSNTLYSKVNDLSGNEFLYVNYKPFCYSVIDLSSYATIEMNPFSTRQNVIKSNEIYYPVIGILKESQDGKEYVNSHGAKFEKEMFKDSMNAFSNSLFRNLNSRKQETINSRIALLNNSLVANSDEGGGGNGENGNFNWVIDVNKKERPTLRYHILGSLNTTKNQFSYSNGGSNGICEYASLS
ncbi:MAG: hypothetical protein PUE07_02950 [bacterium]|nr:hypothetical protein [bacterium]